MNAIALQVNSTKLFQNLRHAFSASAMMGELLQNARRAKATLVQVHYDEATETLTVQDNGTGISDLQNLLTAADSGWDEATIQTEHPFGLGFLSVIYACKQVTVETVGQCFTASTADLLSGKPAPLEPCDLSTGTRITLRGHAWNPIPRFGEAPYVVRKAEMVNLTLGFPLDVMFNAEPMPKSWSMRNHQQWVDTDVGAVWVRDLSQCSHRVTKGLFFQGLPLQTEQAGWREPEPAVIVHLNSTFAVKLPDRQYLVDPRAALLRVDVAVKVVVRDMLAAKKAEVGHEAFVMEWSDACLSAGCVDLMDDIDCLPVAWFIDWEHVVPGFDAYGDNRRVLEALGDGNKVVSRSLLREQGVYELPEEAYENDNAFAAQCWLAFGRKWTLDDRRGLASVGENHWLRRLVQSVGDEDCEVDIVSEVGAEWISVWGDNASNLGVAERIAVRHVAKNESHDGPLAIHDNTLYVTTSGMPSLATRMLSDYIMDDSYQEGAEYRDEQELQRAFQRIMAKDPADLLANILRNADGAFRQPRLVNATVIVEFDENGSFKAARLGEVPTV